MFAPEIVEMPRPRTRAQAKMLPRQNISKEGTQLGTMRQESSRGKHDTPLHSEEQSPLELEMANLAKHHEDKVA